MTRRKRKADRGKSTSVKENSAAVLTIRDAAEMTPEGRRQLADWLRHSAKTLVKHGKDYSKRFRARYLFLEKA